jgi:hypothetical protein
MTPLTKITFFLFLILSVVFISCDEDNDPIAPDNGLVADAGSDYSLVVDETIQLDGSGSHAESKQFFSYLWSITSKPAGSIASLSNTKIVNPIFTANMAGDYVIQLQISQSQQVARDQLTIHVTGSTTSNPIILNESIVGDTNLANVFDDPSKVDYVVIEDIEVKADLVIAPGVVIAFEQDKGLQVVSGSIQAKGTVTNSITFKGTQTEAAFWKGLLIYANESNALEYVTIKDGGSSAYNEIGRPAGIALAGTEITGATLRLANSVITGSGGYGLYVQGSSAIDTFSGNTFTYNELAAAYIPARQLHKLNGNNQATYNGFNGVETGGASKDNDLTWRKDFAGVYHVTSNLSIDGGLTVEPGVALVMDEEVSIIVTPTGYLKATGTANNMISFGSMAVDKYWDGIAFNSASPYNTLDNCIISNAGDSDIADAGQKGNIVVGASGFVSVTKSVIKNGNGYGIVTKDMANLNGDVLTVNNFENLLQGAIYPAAVQLPDEPSLTGTWVDEWTFLHGKNTIDENLYDRESGKWFGGVADPYSANNAGFGLKIGVDGKFIWTNVQVFPVPECPSHTAEYMTGYAAQLQDNWVTFHLDYWRSMFVSSCDPTMNLDTGVSPELFELRYEINEMFDVFTGERYWELKFFRPDESTYSFYRK